MDRWIDGFYVVFFFLNNFTEKKKKHFMTSQIITITCNKMIEDRKSSFITLTFHFLFYSIPTGSCNKK